MSFDRFYSARSYDMVLPALGQQRLDVIGDTIKVLRSDGEVRIETDTGVLLDCLPGQGFRRVYGHLRFTDLSGAENRIRVFAGAGDMIDDRVSGDVVVNDWNAAAQVALENRAYSWAALGITGGGDLPIVQLWNPSGNTKRLVLEHWRVASLMTAIDVVQSGIMTTAVGSAGSMNSHHVDGSLHLCTAELRTDHGAFPSFVGGVISMYDLAPLRQLADTLLKKPYVLEPGNGYCWVGETVGVSIMVTMDWYEEEIL